MNLLQGEQPASPPPPTRPTPTYRPGTPPAASQAAASQSIPARCNTPPDKPRILATESNKPKNPGFETPTRSSPSPPLSPSSPPLTAPSTTRGPYPGSPVPGSPAEKLNPTLSLSQPLHSANNMVRGPVPGEPVPGSQPSKLPDLPNIPKIPENTPPTPPEPTGSCGVGRNPKTKPTPASHHHISTLTSTSTPTNDTHLEYDRHKQLTPLPPTLHAPVSPSLRKMEETPLLRSSSQRKLHGYLVDKKGSQLILKLTSENRAESQSRSRKAGSQPPSSCPSRASSPPRPPLCWGSLPRRSPSHREPAPTEPESERNKNPAQQTRNNPPEVPCSPRPSPRCPGGSREGEGPLSRPQKPPAGPEPWGPRSTPQWTSKSSNSWVDTGAQYAATNSVCTSSIKNKQPNARKDDQKKAGLGTAPRSDGDRHTTPSIIWPETLPGNMQEKQARAELSATKKSESEQNGPKKGPWKQNEISKVVARTTTSTTTTTTRDAEKTTIQQQIERFNNLSRNSTTSTTRSQGTTSNTTKATQEIRKRKRENQTTTTTTDDKINNKDGSGSKKLKIIKDQNISRMFEKMHEQNNKNQKMNNEETTTTTRCEEKTTTTTDAKQDVKQEDEQRNQEEAQQPHEASMKTQQNEAKKTTTSREQQHNKREDNKKSTRRQQKEPEDDKNKPQQTILKYVKKQQQQQQKKSEEQQPSNTVNKQQQQQKKPEQNKTTMKTQQQQHPKLTIKSKGIEITDMKLFLANKRKNRAARLGGENRDNKSKPAVSHTQPISKFFNIAHTGMLDGIIGRDENQGMENQRCQGD